VSHRERHRIFRKSFITITFTPKFVVEIGSSYALYLVTLEVWGWSPHELRFLFIDPQRMRASTGLDPWDFNFLPELVCPRETAKRPSRVRPREAAVFEFNLPIHENRVDPFR
jgi:hypothetical protein